VEVQNIKNMINGPLSGILPITAPHCHKDILA